MSCFCFFRCGCAQDSCVTVVSLLFLFPHCCAWHGPSCLTQQGGSGKKKNCCMIQLPTMNPFGYISFCFLVLGCTVLYAACMHGGPSLAV
ncbi:hypothetical protein V8C43DRAFT_272039 [Trichoderma afarasin]